MIEEKKPVIENSWSERGEQKCHILQQTFVGQVLPILDFGPVRGLVEERIQRIDDFHVGIEKIEDDGLARESKYLPW